MTLPGTVEQRLERIDGGTVPAPAHRLPVAAVPREVGRTVGVNLAAGEELPLSQDRVVPPQRDEVPYGLEEIVLPLLQLP